MGKMDNNLFSLKILVSKTELKMLCYIDLHYFLYYRLDSTVAYQEIKVVRFLGLFHLCLFLNYVSQTTKSNLLRYYYQIRSTGFPKQKINFLPLR